MSDHPANEDSRPPLPRRRAGGLPGAARRRLLPFVLLLAALSSLVLLAGCGGPSGEGGSTEPSSGSEGDEAREGSQEKPSPVEAVRVAYKTTAEAETSRVSMTTIATGAPGGNAGSGIQQAPTTFSLTAEGVVDYAGGNAAMTMRFPGAGAIEMRMLGDVAYQKMPEEARGQTTGGKPWAKIDMERLYREQYGASPAEMRSGAPSDPTDQLGYLRGVSEGVEEAGEEEVRGVATTHYEATIDLKRAAEQEEGAARQATEKMAEQIGSDEIPTEVWIDGEGRVRRYAMSITLPEDPGGGPAAGGAVTVVQELYDFGVPVRVEPPPLEQTEDVTDEVLEQSSPEAAA